MLTGASATIVVRIFGPELDVLQRKAAEVGKVDRRRARRPADLKVQALTLVPQVEVRSIATARAAGRRDARRPSRHGGDHAARGEGRRGLRRAEDLRRGGLGRAGRARRPVRPARLPIDLASGGYTPLVAVADVRVAPTPNEITREGGSRRIDVTCNVRDRDLGAVARDIEAAMAGVHFDAGYHPEVLGEYAAPAPSRSAGSSRSAWCRCCRHPARAARRLRSARMVALVALTLPFALIGGVASVFLTGGVLSLGSLVGFVTVLGIAARNGIMLVSHYRHLEREEGVPFGRGAGDPRRRGAPGADPDDGAGHQPGAGADRARRRSAGHEIEHPMAVVILGGLVTSTVLNLFLLPAIYLRYGRSAPAGSGFGLAIMTSVDLITATAASPRRSFSARTASAVITAVNA